MLPSDNHDLRERVTNTEMFMTRDIIPKISQTVTDLRDPTSFRVPPANRSTVIDIIP